MIEKFKCAYPGCKKEGIHSHTLELINEEGSSVKLPFCDYHYFIVMGGHFKARVEGKEEASFELIGPMHAVEIAEQVIAAREMIAKLKSDN